MTPRPKIVLVAAVARDRTIGKGGAIPWRIPEDMKRFRRVTTGTVLVMGRKTFESIGKPLPGRETVVVTRTPEAFSAAHPGTFAAASVDAAIALAASRGATTVSIAGGGDVYAAALPVADELMLTFVPHDGGGDAFFPEWDESAWVEIAREPVGTAVAVHYRRR